jgi:hypothetical protein
MSIIKTLYEEYLQERAFDSKGLRIITAELSDSHAIDLSSQTKRPADAEHSQPFVKQARYDAVATPAPGPYAGYPAGGYGQGYTSSAQDAQQYGYNYAQYPADYNAHAGQYQ